MLHSYSEEVRVPKLLDPISAERMRRSMDVEYPEHLYLNANGKLNDFWMDQFYETILGDSWREDLARDEYMRKLYPSLYEEKRSWYSTQFLRSKALILRIIAGLARRVLRLCGVDNECHCEL